MELDGFPQHDGVHVLSAPQQFAGGEQAYDERIGGAHGADLLRCGRGAWQLLLRDAGRPITRLLELGAGGGTCTLGLVALAPQVEFLITDTSPQFLNLIRRKLGAAAAPVAFATLAGEDLHLLPDASQDAIVIASALHHVGDWRGFLREAARVLPPGGVLAIQEPFREGNLIMAQAIGFALSPLWPGDSALPEADAEKLRRCRDSIGFLANTQIEKHGEDKHNFLASDLHEAGTEAGFARARLYRNRHFEDLADTDLANPQAGCSLVAYLDSFLEHHHQVSAAAMASLRAHLFPAMQHLDEVFVRGDGPPLLGCMVFRR